MKKSLCAISILAVFGFGIYHFAWRRQVDSYEPPLVAVRAAPLPLEEVFSGVRFSATIRERKRVELSFKVGGQVATLHQVRDDAGRMRDVQEGDLLEANSELARLDEADFRRDLQAALERLDQAKARLAAARAKAENARSELDRISPLAAKKIVAASTLDDAVASAKATAADVDAASKELTGAELHAEQARDQLANCRLVVPFPQATVAARRVETDERIAPGEPAFVLLDVAALVASFGVPDRMVGQLALGQELDVVCDALSMERFRGRVTKIAPAADERSRTFPVEVTVDRPGALRPGMIVAINVGRKQAVRLAPLSSLRKGPTRESAVVFRLVQEHGRTVVRETEVRLGEPYDHRVAVESVAGSADSFEAPIVIEGASRLHDGQEVQVIDYRPSTSATANYAANAASDHPIVVGLREALR